MQGKTRSADPAAPVAGTRRFRSLRIALLFAAALLPGMLFASVPVHATTATEALLTRLHRQGYPSADAAVAQLQATPPAPNAAQTLRRRYYADLARLALQARRTSVATDALAQLGAMAKEKSCAPCQVQWLVGRAEQAVHERALGQARALLQRARTQLAGNDTRLRQHLASVEAVTFGNAGQLPEAIERAVEASALAERLGHTADRIWMQATLVTFNADLGDLDRARALAGEALAAAKAIDFRPVLGTLHLNLGHVHALAGAPERQRVALTRALEIAHGDPGLLDIEILSLTNLADYHLARGEHAQALQLANRAAALADAAGMSVFQAMALTNAGIAAAGLGEHATGIAQLERAIDIVSEHGLKRYVVAITSELIKVQVAAGRYREALQRTEQVAALTDEFNRQAREDAVIELQEKYSAERKSREIARLSAVNALRQAEITARTREQRLWAALAIALAVATLLLVLHIRRVRRANRRLRVDNAALAQETSTDQLTGSYNRRHAQELMRQYERDASSFAAAGVIGLLMLDVDRFKQINDQHGHAAGDAVLVAVATRLGGLVRRGDVLARWGGEEFLLLLPAVTLEGLLALAERALQAISDEPVAVGDTRIQVTVSAGAVLHDLATGRPWEDSLHVADQAMYRAKAGGRHRAICVLDTLPDRRMHAVRGDLEAAHASGAIRLQVVDGPVLATTAA